MSSTLLSPDSIENLTDSPRENTFTTQLQERLEKPRKYEFDKTLSPMAAVQRYVGDRLDSIPYGENPETGKSYLEEQVGDARTANQILFGRPDVNVKLAGHWYEITNNTPIRARVPIPSGVHPPKTNERATFVVPTQVLDAASIAEVWEAAANIGGSDLLTVEEREHGLRNLAKQVLVTSLVDPERGSPESRQAEKSLVEQAIRRGDYDSYISGFVSAKSTGDAARAEWEARLSS